ncbi:ankyrin [Sarocladium strictum]
MSCGYKDLPNFSDVFDPRFTSFASDFSALVNRVLEHKTVTIKTPRVTSLAESPTRRGARSTKRGRRTRSGRAASVATSHSSDSEDDNFVSWQKRKQYEEDRTHLDSFLQSFHGWTHENTGHDVFVLTGTCDWISTSQALSTWIDYTMYGTFFWLAAPGSGKTHRSKALATHIAKKCPNDVVLTYYCSKNESMPHIWEYFTWSLLQARPSYFSSVPKMYQNRDKSSPRLGFGDFIDLWTGIRLCEGEDDMKDTVWLIIDGLEACGDAVFLGFWKALEQLRKRQIDTSKSSSYLKVLFAGTLTPAMAAVAGGVSRYLVSPEVIKDDISTYVDVRLNKCIHNSTLLDIESNVEAIRAEIKELSEDYWPFARDAVSEVELVMARDANKIASFKGRLPEKLEKHVRQTVLTLRQSIGPQRYLFPLLHILLANHPATELTELNVYQLKDALCSLYEGEEIRKIDLEGLIRDHLGGLLTWTATGSLRFRHAGFAAFLGRDVPDCQLNADIAFVCLTYLLQEKFGSMPSPEQLKNPLGWLKEAHPFYSFAVCNCQDLIARSGGGDDRLGALFLRFFLERPPQWKVSREWLKWCSGFNPREERFHDLAIDPVIWDERLLPLLERLCPPPTDLARLSPIQLVKASWSAWRWPQRTKTPRYSLPPGWLSSRGGMWHTPLLGAAKEGNVDMVRYILKWRPNVNERGGLNMRSILMMLYCSTSCGTPEERPTRLTRITEDLYEQGANLNLGDAEGCCPLHVACDQDSLPLVRALLDHGASIDIGDAKGYTAWQTACERGTVDVLREFVDRGVDAESLFDTGETALTYMAQRGQLEQLRTVVRAADVNAIDRKGVAPIHRAVLATQNRYELLAFLVSQPDIDLDILQDRVYGDGGVSALDLAVQQKDRRAVELLLRAGATAGHLPGLKCVPLLMAVENKSLDIVELLLRHRAPVNAFNLPQKQNALTMAASSCNVDMMRLLLDYGADPTVYDGLKISNAAYTVLDSDNPDIEALQMLLKCAHPPTLTEERDPDKPLQYAYSNTFIRACRIKDTKFVEALLEGGIDLSTWLELPKTCSPVHAAVWAGNIDVCRLLLDKEPRYLDFICCWDGVMHSPLHDACVYGQPEMAKFLLERGADVKLRTPVRQQTPLLLACVHGDAELIKIILAADPSVANVCCYSGMSPLHEASLHGHVKTVEALLKAGASPSTHHNEREGSVSRALLTRLGSRAIPLLKLYLQHGLDLNDVSPYWGHTHLSDVIDSATPAVVRLMLERGGDPLRTFRLAPSLDQWEHGLSSTWPDHTPEVIDMLLAPQRDRLATLNWMRENALGKFSKGWRPYLARLYWLCEDIQRETSRDIFAEIMAEVDVCGLSPVDRALGLKDCRPEYRSDLARLILEYVDLYLQSPSRSLLSGIELLLLEKLAHETPQDLAPILTLVWSVQGVKSLPDERTEVAASALMYLVCCRCYETPYDSFWYCAECACACCVECAKTEKKCDCTEDKKPKHIEVPLDAGATVESPEVQEAFKKLRELLTSMITKPPEDSAGESVTVIEEPVVIDEKEAQLQTSLQLAALHAFDMLAIRRPMGTTFLPLSVRAADLISPFESNIAEMRKSRERQALDMEMTVERRKEELNHMSKDMGRLAYLDEQLFRKDMVLEQMAGLFGEEVKS